jgi:hypothetical protein
MARPCHLPFGTFPASVAAGINLFDVLAHTCDARQYAPEVPVTATASPRQRFLAFTGRVDISSR